MTKTFIPPPKMVLPPFYTFLRLSDGFCVISKKKSKKMWRAYCTLERYLKKKNKNKKTSVLGQYVKLTTASEVAGAEEPIANLYAPWLHLKDDLL